MKSFKRYSRHITRGPRWKALRVQALQRDGWKCVCCAEKIGLEIDHIKPVRDRPDLAWSLENLQTLCGQCHAKKTRIETGYKPLSPKRQQWRTLLREKQLPSEGNF
ncbi:HNH endonuclease [Ponticaulis koreensis]|uniref:HNH endonuclease n=1 Tax=Ponticaulis koreensis TaxID=1123045 RepID=UPI001F3AB04C|nr:HNH endonuclease signature motif containing protein [Ponticaulis koreensis]